MVAGGSLPGARSARRLSRWAPLAPTCRQGSPMSGNERGSPRHGEPDSRESRMSDVEDAFSAFRSVRSPVRRHLRARDEHGRVGRAGGDDGECTARIPDDEGDAIPHPGSLAMKAPRGNAFLPAHGHPARSGQETCAPGSAAGVKRSWPESGHPDGMKRACVAQRLFPGARASRLHGQWRASGPLRAGRSRPWEKAVPEAYFHGKRS